MKRAALLPLVLAALLAPAGVRAQAIAAGFGGNVSSLVSVPFDVPLIVDMTARPERLGAFAARIQWNPAVLQYQVFVNGSFGTITTNTDSTAQGILRLTGANPAGAAGLITLGTGRFLPLVADTMTMVLSLPELYAAGTFADLRPSVTVSNGEFCPAVGRFGDIDGDGQVNSRDALIALMAAVGLDVSQYPITLGDVDGNGVVDTRDALIMLSSAVGIDVSAFRIGVILGGACANVVPVTLAISPSAVAGVLPGQQVSFEVRAAGPTGSLVIVPNPVVKSSDTTVLTFRGGGNPATAVAVAPGTATVTAIRDGRDSVKTTVTVVGRRYTHFVDAKAATAANQLGTAAFPFATIAQAVLVARGGDTIRPQPGRYLEQVWLDSAVVLMGDTLPDGSRPVIALDSAGAYAGLNLVGSSTAEVDNLGITGYYAAVDVFGPTHVVLRGLRTTGTTEGVVVDSLAGFLRLESSQLVGLNSSYYYDGYGVLTNARVDTLVLQGTEISDFGYGGVYAVGADSTAVLQSLIHDVGDYGIEGGVYGGDDCVEDCAAPHRSASDLGPLAPALVVSGSTIERTGYELVYLDEIRSASFSHNHFSNPDNYGVEIYGNSAGWVRIAGDSMGVNEDWLYAEYLDSLVVDSAWVSSPYPYGETYDVFTVRMTNTQFVGAQDRALEVYFGGVTYGGQVFLDNVSVIGDPSCDLCAQVLYADGPRVTASRITGVNLDYGFEVYGDSSFTLTNSLFRHVEYPVYWEGSGTDSTSRLTVRGTTFSGFDEAIEAYDGGLAVDSNTFQNGEDEGVYWDGYQRASVTRNSFASVEYPVELEAYQPSSIFTDTIANNVITDLSYEGIYASGEDSVPFRILGNAVTCNQTGRSDGYGIELESAGGTLTGNQVNGCSSSIALYDDHSPPRVDSVLGNVVTVPANAYQGIYVEGSIKSRIANNALTGDTAGSSYYGDIWVSGYGYQPGPTTTVDSNAVTGGTTGGIYVKSLDTALVRFNAVRGVNATSSSWGGIVTDGSLTFLAQVYGNQVRGMFGNGIRIYNGDTAMVQVDSNLVDASSANGIELDGGADSVTNNRISHSGVAGVLINYDVDINRSRVTANDIEHNAFGVQAYEYAYSALNNWWGAASGPSVSGCDTCGTGDSISIGLLFNPWAHTEFVGSAPSPAARALPILALRAPAGVRAVKAPAPTGLDAPVVKKVRVARAASPARSPRALSTTARAPVGLKPAQAQVWRRAAALRASAFTVAAQRAQARVARAQARAQAQQALVQRLEQRKAQHETRLKARQARQAAARAASTRGPQR
ncbi:MAG: right-handed parallel beta-helix repeat-containing protein [Gemmatimonadales bacterium]|jgi:hypothetical protein